MRFLAALLSAALALPANGLAQLLPAGKFAARDGRPGPGQHWTLSDAQGRALADAVNAVTTRTPLSIDYEHQTLMAPANGLPAPAAGWIVRVEWRDGLGLFADVAWTDRARAAIAANEYRYISPVIQPDEHGVVVGLFNAALVSVPALVGMDAVQAALGALAAGQTANPFHPHKPTEAPHMDLAQLIALLGLPTTATAADVQTALTALRARPAVPAALATALGLQAGADEAAALGALTTLRTTPDTHTMTAMAALQQQVAALSGQIADREVTELVDGAVRAGKLVPAQRDWALQLGRGNLAQLKTFVASAPAIPGLAGQDPQGGKQGGAGAQTPDALSAQGLQVAQAMGIAPDAWRAHVAKDAAKAAA